MTITTLWDEITIFEDGEQKNDSTNHILANARQGARVEAYTNLQDKLLDDQLQNPCFHCETMVMLGEQESILPAEFEVISNVFGIKSKMPLCGKHYSEWLEMKEDEER